MTTFSTLAAALAAGFQVEDRTATGYLVRTMTQKGWQRALVVLK
jgi:hypothetical protein